MTEACVVQHNLLSPRQSFDFHQFETVELNDIVSRTTTSCLRVSP